VKKQVALSAIGRDRPGIVAALSNVLFEKGCNLEESSMTLLKGDFSVLLLITLPDKLEQNELQKALETVAQKLNLALILREVPSPSANTLEVSCNLTYTLVLYGVDHPGILYRVAQTAADLKINITDLRTHVTEGSKGPIYSLIMEIEVPGTETAERFKVKLEGLKKELEVEITFKPVEMDEL
jgi:glycine cleavage system transcriptional repressor